LTRALLGELLFNFFAAGRLGPLLALAGFGTRFEETGFFAIGVLTSRFFSAARRTPRGGCHTGRDGTVSGTGLYKLAISKDLNTIDPFIARHCSMPNC
jgi:hypothetical protein